MKTWSSFATVAAVLLVFAGGAASAAGSAKDYRLSPLTAEAAGDGVALHGAVCRKSVQVRREAPTVILRETDAAGRVVSVKTLALYGRFNQRTGGCAYFNTTVRLGSGARAEVCVADGDRPGQCMGA